MLVLMSLTYSAILNLTGPSNLNQPNKDKELNGYDNHVFSKVLTVEPVKLQLDDYLK